ncbi:MULTISPECIES: TetR/AcrR family transcriptional regulator [Pseudomonas]|uniref:TetR/AcrR family transcriptional regulator n=2 Tax=Pseudomonas fluorescens group TaxID=136843 RepID=A0A7Z6MYZ1_PSEFL|nr:MULTISPECIES: TetR/AcrR family transcriptional regulator [Pseudomonas]AIG02072.1 TetR family transcriptional regulator [Pseudomonas fluorescens]EPL09970.1 putative transcriptional regulator [Pseudomonas sp. CF150]NMY07292.1 TetR/AcrR family transcriptional regulator [Pseudomonas veronii]RDS90924.1 TetR/AcrR family transcriptional regulator [Pseudomonas fluorescens]WRU60781.1 TetR/AcrR family transcriptional regulator [Pseudomonas veronii]
MRPLKIPRDELLQRCANTFKRLGYHGTTMDALSSACGLTKASFYHHYPNKESLLRDVLGWTHERLKQSLFSIAFDENLAPQERLTSMGRKAKKLFQDDSIGCLMGVVAVDATYGKVELMEPIRLFLDDWTAAFAKLYSAGYSQEEAQRLARQLVADFEGAILLARIYGDPSYIDAVTERGLHQLESAGVGV